MRAIIAILFLPVLSAGTIQLTGLGYGKSDVTMVKPAGNPYSVYATELHVQKDGQTYLAYCIDLFTTIGISTYENVTGTPDGYPGGTRAAWIYETYAGLVRSNESAAALQVALWDVVHDGGDGLGLGAIRLGTGDAALRAQSESIIMRSVGQASMGATIFYNSEMGSGERRQTLIASVPESDVTATPEPGTMAMLGFGLAASYGFHRWRKGRT